jgi:hypothetical protein
MLYSLILERIKKLKDAGTVLKCLNVFRLVSFISDKMHTMLHISNLAGGIFPFPTTALCLPL